MAAVARSVIVVGGGIAGLGTALGLVRRGVDVTVVDRGTSGGGATYGNAGWVSIAQAGPLPAPGVIGYGVRSLADRGSALRFVPRGVPAIAPWLARFAWHARRGPYTRGVAALGALGGRTVAMLDELAGEGVAHTGLDTGLLIAAIDRAAVEHEHEGLAPLVAAGAIAEPGEILDGDSVRALEPLLADTIAAGFLVAEHRQVEPWLLARALTRHLRGLGVRFAEGVAVTALELGPRRVRARTGAEVLDAEAVVLATGAQVGELAAHVGARLPVIGGKGYSFDVTGTAALSRPVMFCDAHVAVSPMGDRVRVAGTMELPATSTVVVQARADALRAAARERTTGWSGESLPWAGLRPLAPDGLPIVDRLVDPGVFVATGYGMLGMTVGLPAGDALAELICSGERPTVLEPFRAGRRI
jgi:D-amino-acid dehydrogenase